MITKKMQNQEYISLIKNAQHKSNRMLASADGVYEKVKAVRPLFLKIIKIYDELKHDHDWGEFWNISYKKSCQWLKEIDVMCESIELKVKEENYIRTFKKNLKKMKKMCEDTSISYYSLLPDRIPIDVRTHCIQFISQAVI